MNGPCKTTEGTTSSKKKPRHKVKDASSKKPRHKVQDAALRKKKRITHIGFDPDARNQYLTGFSERKRQRRVYGLAMQKVKDRKAKLEAKAELKSAVKEQIIEAERRKESILESGFEACDELTPDNDDNASTEEETTRQSESEPKTAEVQLYEDNYTRNKWGGEVIVTTTTDFPSDDDDGDVVRGAAMSISTDKAQEFSGKVERYINELKGKLPSSKRDARRHNQPTMTKGKHGALNMPGIGGDKNLKIAKKMLARTQPKTTEPSKKKFKKSHKR